MFAVIRYGRPSGTQEILGVDGLVNTHEEFIAYVEKFKETTKLRFYDMEKDYFGSNSLSFPIGGNDDITYISCEPIDFIKL